MQTEQIKKAPSEKYLLHRRFDRMGRLVGDEAMRALFDAHVMIIGIGGVGSWAAESLARSGIGKITLVDFDEICITNANRQLHAVQGVVGKKKVEVMAERLRKINPQAQVEAIPLFYNAETSEQILALNPDWIVDCIDNITAKCHLLSVARERKLAVLTSAGAGSRIDPLKIKIADLAQTYQDAFAHQIRKELRTHYQFPRTGDFGIPCVFSDEPMSIPEKLSYDKEEGFQCVCPQGQNDYHSCDRRSIIHGTASFLTGSFGLVMASFVVREISDQARKQKQIDLLSSESGVK